MRLLILLFFMTSFNIKEVTAQFLTKEEVYKVYGLRICATEVGTGSKKFSGTGLSYYETSLLDNPQVVKLSANFMADLGTYRVSYNNYTAGTKPLFNLSADRNSFPLLDTIDIDFYRTRGLDKMIGRNPKLLSDNNFIKLRDIIRDSTNWTSKKMKNFIFAKEFDAIRPHLILSRYDTLIKPFAIDRKSASVSTIKLKASLDQALINSGVPINAKLTSYIQNIADINTKVFGFYYIAQLDPDYVAKIQFFLSNITEYKTRLDQFAYYLKDYLNNPKAAANTELVAIKLNGTYDRKKVNVDSIALDLSTKFGIGNDKASSLAASLTIEFSKNETTTVSTAINNTYILRYFTSKQVDELIFKPLRNYTLMTQRFK